MGWVMNTPAPKNTVVGEYQGSDEACAKMKHWLEKTGSPKSVISWSKISPVKDVESDKREVDGNFTNMLGVDIEARPEGKR